MPEIQTVDTTKNVRGYTIRPIDAGVVLSFNVGDGEVGFVLEADKMRHLAMNLIRACDLHDETHSRIPPLYKNLPFHGISEIKELNKGGPISIHSDAGLVKAAAVQADGVARKLIHKALRDGGFKISKMDE